MLYYRVTADADNRTRYLYSGTSYKLKESGILIGGELYTPREREKIANSDKFFEKVYISKRRVYFLFGARFESRPQSKERGV